MTYVDAAAIDYGENDVLRLAKDYERIETAEAWRPYLEGGSSWLNASLIRLTDGSAVIALEAGRDVSAPPDALSINFSSEPRPGVVG